MKYKVLNKQTVSRNCFICGENNVAGLKMYFYEIDTDEVVGFFKGSEIHCSYPDRMHGGVISAILDETIGRAIMIRNPELLGFTTQLSVKFRKPVPIGIELICVGRVTNDTSRIFMGSGEILNEQGEVLASAQGTYFKVDTEKLSSGPNADIMYLSDKSDNKETIEINRE